MLWRISFMVEGKHLERVLEDCTGVAINMEGPTLVVNAEAKKGKLKAKTNTGSQPARVVAALEAKYKGGDRISSDEIHAAMKSEHIPANNYGFIVTGLKKLGRLTIIERGLWMFHSAAQE